MANDWNRLNQQFMNEYALTKISVKEWCEKNNLIYNTARRYIKIIPKLAQLRGDALSSEDVKNAQESFISKSNKDQIQSLRESEEDEVIYDNSAEIPGSKKRVKSLGNQNARTYGHYSEFISTDQDAQRYSSAILATLQDELNLMRMQLSNLMVVIKKVEADLRSELTAEQKVRLYKSYAKYQDILNVKIARIESLANSLMSQAKMKADIEKSNALTHKTQLEADKLGRDSGDSKTPLDEIYNDILNMDNNGMMNT
ncbi:cell-division initiation protein DivIVA [Psychromonas ingrahamii 37]|uniref:Cell-division initiation protein DivIVA n=1 Tax=Psychromonas ingrahamii (strain DSM 17664 / CCUG 51855 / 37) TaxID=357804 RepID=A1SRJ7_PSYIN|nr:hypothetical protein [Psychromonas ingrahamii]ABM02112.1 cell-division initiation protein DivIVA [Psychromonas ingrahamii 37]